MTRFDGTRFDGASRFAAPGELCPCGRQAQVVYVNTDGTEIGYCDLPDKGIDKSEPCPFCGGKWPQYGICPLYQIRPLVKGQYRDQGQDQRQDQGKHEYDECDENEDEEGR